MELMLLFLRIRKYTTGVNKRAIILRLYNSIMAKGPISPVKQEK